MHKNDSLNPRYAIILITFNRLKYLKVVIEKVKGQTLLPSLLVIVDNQSSDGTHEYLDDLKADWPIKKIKTSANIGHGAALAVGMEHVNTVAEIDYLLLLEDDSFPKPNLAETMLSTIQTWNYKILSLDGFNISIGKRIRPPLSYSKPVDVDFALLDGAIISMEVLRTVGYPKKDFFMMCDDLEYSKRIRKYGLKIGCIKSDSHEILHLGGGKRFTRSTLWRGYYQARNNIHILKEYFSFFELLDFLIIESKRTMGCFLAKDRFHRIYLRLLGVLHGIIGKKGKTLDPSQF